MSIHKERKAAVKFLESRGWTIDEDRHTATHPDAAREIHVGGPYGWPMPSIRREVAHALGHRGDRTNRAKAVAQSQAAKAAEFEQAAQQYRTRVETHLVEMIRRDADLALVAHAREQLAGKAWTFTPHALDRMTERGITRADVLATIADPLDVHLDGRSIRIVGARASVVLDLEHAVVITAHAPAPLPVRDRRPLVAAR